MRVLSLAAALALGLATASPAPAETSLTAYDAVREALIAVWAELPLTARHVSLIEGTAPRYGSYTPRTGNSFAAGEEIHVYLELLGYGWRDNDDGTRSALLDFDLDLKAPDGVTVARQPKFFSTEIASDDRLLETFLTLNATLGAFPAGDYTLHYTVHDLAGGKSATFDVPVTLVAAPAG